MGLFAEFDPLRQGQILRVIDRVGLAAHVALPGVAAALPSAAGFLLAAERAADLRAARAGGDVGHAAVAAANAEELLGLAHVVGENGGTEALGHGILHGGD